MSKFSQLTDQELWDLIHSDESLDKVEAANELHERLHARGEHERALAVATTMVSTAVSLSNEMWEARGYFLEGLSFFFLDEFKQSAESYQHAIRIWVEHGENGWGARAALNACDSLMKIKEYSAVVELAEQAQSLADMDENSEFSGDALYFKSRAQYFSSDFSDEEALATLSAAREATRAAALVNKVSRIDDFAATVLEFLGRYPEAADALRDCLTFARETGDDNDVSYALFRYAENLRKQRQFDDAEKLLNECKEISSRKKYFRRLAQCEYGLSHCFEHTARLEEAVEAAYRARALFDYLGSDNQVAYCDDSLSDIFWRSNEYERAIQANRKVISHAESYAGWEWYEYIARTKIAENFYHLKMLEECAQTLDEPQSDEEYEEPIEGLIARLYLRARIAADKGLWPDAKAYAEEALELTNQDEDYVNFRTPWLYEIIGLELERRADGAATKYFTEATALHLTFGNDDHAREVAKRLLPKPAKKQRPAENTADDESNNQVPFN